MSRYIDADAIEYHEIFEEYGFVRVAYADDIDNIPTADVVERKESLVNKEDCYCLFEEIEGKKNIHFRLRSAITNVTDIRIALDKFNLKEVMSGKWNDTTETVGWPKWSCSVCGGDGRGDYKYCPWCGAGMQPKALFTEQ